MLEDSLLERVAAIQCNSDLLPYRLRHSACSHMNN